LDPATFEPLRDGGDLVRRALNMAITGMEKGALHS